VFALGNLALVIVLQLTALRFGYVWFALGPAALFAALSRLRAGVPMAAAPTAGILIPQVPSIARALSAESIANYCFAKQLSKQLGELLNGLPATVKKAYVVDDLVIRPRRLVTWESSVAFAVRLCSSTASSPLPIVLSPNVGSCGTA
jgi:hypothetical protein